MANTCVFEFQVVAEDKESIEKALNHFNEENEVRILKGINLVCQQKTRQIL